MTTQRKLLLITTLLSLTAVTCSLPYFASDDGDFEHEDSYAQDAGPDDQPPAPQTIPHPPPPPS